MRHQRKDRGLKAAPWSDDEVEAIQEFQRGASPFTCWHCPETPLVPTPEGLVCKLCKHEQPWVPVEVLTGRWASWAWSADLL